MDRQKKKYLIWVLVFFALYFINIAIAHCKVVIKIPARVLQSKVLKKNIRFVKRITRNRKKEIELLKTIYARDMDTDIDTNFGYFAAPLKILDQVSPFGEIRQKKYFGIKGTQLVPHNGIDFRAAMQTPIFAVEKGIVALAKKLSGSGNTLIIDHGHGLMSLYFHLSKFKVKIGQVVKKEQTIALSGKSGKVTGPHLHFEARRFGVPKDPNEFFESKGIENNGDNNEEN